MHNLKVDFKVVKIFSEEDATPIVGADIIKSPQRLPTGQLLGRFYYKDKYKYKSRK